MKLVHKMARVSSECLNSAVITVHAEVVVEDLKERERVPCIGELFGQDGVHVHGEERPKYLGVFDEQVAEPGECLQSETESFRTHQFTRKCPSCSTMISVCETSFCVCLASGTSNSKHKERLKMRIKTLMV